ncbi:MAG TPA: hypothetical protein VIF60_21740 [Burkholderiaceae bacterium]|jgi:hypothetical protein
MPNEIRKSYARNARINDIDSAPAARRVSNIVRAVWIICVLACALQPQSSAQATTLDSISVQSAFGQPLRARISMHRSAQLGAECVRASIETMDGNPLANADVRIMHDGATPMLLLSTVDPVREPAINLAVQIICQPQETRAFAVLLDLDAPLDAASAVSIPLYGIADAHAASKLPMPITDGKHESSASEAGSHAGSLLGDGLNLSLSRFLSEVHLPSADGMSDAKTDTTDAPVAQGLQGFASTPVSSSMEFAMPDWLPSRTIHEHWQPMLLACAGFLALLMLPLRGAQTKARKSVNKCGVRYNKKPAQGKMLDPIPYIKPNMQFSPAQKAMAKVRPQAIPAPIANSASGDETTARFDERFVGDLLVRLPQYRAEEVEDELQLAQFWMGFNQPLRAMEVLESRWGNEQPSSPLPWQYLLQIYKITGDLDKYRNLISRYQNAFGKRADKRNSAPDKRVGEVPAQAYRMRA